MANPFFYGIHSFTVSILHGNSTTTNFFSFYFTVYSCFTITLLADNNSLPSTIAGIYTTICFLALASHIKTSLTDPGTIPANAVPIPEDAIGRVEFPVCAICNTYKPPRCHHCRICNRCIAGMDHHCPWMNNCVGYGNMKHYILFLIYVWIGAAYALLVFGWNYFLCSTEECIFGPTLVYLVRLMTLICVVAVVFVSSMLMNVLWGIMTGIGTIDRMQRFRDNSFDKSDDAPISLFDIFGIGPLYTWFIPTDPLIPDFDRLMGYSSSTRLLREEGLREKP